MLKTTIGQIMVNDSLPEELKDYSRVLDSKSSMSLMQALADKHPDKYKDVAKKLYDVGREVAYNSGGFSFGLKDLRESKSSIDTKARLRAAIDTLMSDRNLDEDARNKSVVDLLNSSQKKLETDIFNDSVKENNQLAKQIMSGSRGKPMNLKSCGVATCCTQTTMTTLFLSQCLALIQKV